MAGGGGRHAAHSFGRRRRRGGRPRPAVAPAHPQRRAADGSATDAPSPWARDPLGLSIRGRAKPLVVVNEYAALLASGVSPSAADALMMGARHGVWLADEGPAGGQQQAQKQASAATRNADNEFYSQDTGPWTGGNIWESGEVLARLLTAPGGSWTRALPDAKVVDVGCGTGVVGLAAALQGAHVTLTDRVLACAEHNRDVNLAPEEKWRCELSRLSWGDLAAAEQLRSARGPFDFIFTADTLYNSADQESLADTIAALADRSAHTQVVVATPNSGEIFLPLSHVGHGFDITDISDEPEVKAAFQSAAEAVGGAAKVAARHASRRQVKIYSMRQR